MEGDTYNYKYNMLNFSGASLSKTGFRRRYGSQIGVKKPNKNILMTISTK